MHLNGPQLTRTLLIPAVVLLFGIAAIISITELQTQASNSAAAQLKLARTETALNALQTAPFRANVGTGGSPKIARHLMNTGEREIDRALAELERESPPAALRQTAAPLRRNYATLERIYDLGITGGYGKNADGLSAITGRQTEQIIGDIRRTDRVYQERSTTADSRATLGSAGVILLLVVGFGFLYRRSTKAREMAEGLVIENCRLLATSRVEALTDALTGLPNRRALRRDLALIFDGGGDGKDHTLALFDLDGFKLYNDTFGHPAGDALLARLGVRLSEAVSGQGSAYRMGGDEFCVLAPLGWDDAESLAHEACEALSEAGEAFDIGCSFGRAHIPGEAGNAEVALHLADQRMYEQKVGRSSPIRQSSDVLLTVLSERNPGLHHHLSVVAELAEAVGRAYGLSDIDVQWVRLAAELHDVGKVAIPDAILNKPGPLSDEEWTFMRRHPLIGERIIRSAPSLAPAAQLVRSSHERYDGTGYPDGLSADQIEVGASIISVCDAYDAMVSHRVYRKARSMHGALTELRACAGTQFDPAIVELFCTTMEERDVHLKAAHRHDRDLAAAQGMP
jgi:diguanylate cyclase (GGDEF)-like protein